MSIQEARLKDIADAIREKDGTAEPIPAGTFAQRIRAIHVGSDFAVPLVVAAEPGAEITAVNGEDTLTATADDTRRAVLLLERPGAWSVSAKLGGLERGPEILEVASGYEMTFSFQASRLPEGYTELEYISNPNGAYIYDFGISATDIWSNRLEFSIELLDDSQKQYFFGGTYSYYQKGTSVTTSRGCHNVLYFDNSSQGKNICFNYGYHNASSSGYTPVTTPYTNSRMDIVVDVPKLFFSVNEEATTLSSHTGKTNSRVPSLFAGSTYSYFYNATVSSNKPSTYTNYGSNPANMRLYSLKVYSSTADDTGDLVHNYVPAKTDKGVVGLFDLVSETFYSSYEADKNFEAGPAL